MNATTLDLRRPSTHVAEVWLNRPDVRNASNDAVITERSQAFTAFGADSQLRAIVLVDHGKAFCAGADLNWMRQMAGYSWQQNRTDAERLAEMLLVIWSCPMPVVGRVHGDCYAGGVGLAAVCDVIVAALVANGPVALRACKQLVKDIAGRPISPELRTDTARRIADIRAGDEGREGVGAFLGKREPSWRST